MSNEATNAEHDSKKGILDNGPVVASSAGGIGLLVYAFVKACFPIQVSKSALLVVAPDIHELLLMISPVIGGFITAFITYIWQAFGKDPAQIKYDRKINRAIKNALKDLKDPHLPAEEKEKARAQYALLRNLLRSENHTISPEQDPAAQP